MSTIPMYNSTGAEAGEMELADSLLKSSKNMQVVHDAITAYRANQRAGTASTKTRSDVRGGGRKPYKQKGTGQARAGTLSSPIRRGGGVTFGPHPRDYSKKLTKKAAQSAFRTAVAKQLDRGTFRVVEEFAVSEPKTRLVADLLKAQGVTGKVLLVVDTIDQNLGLASRNVDGLEVVTASDLNVYQVMRYRTALITKAGLGVLEDRLRKYAGSAS